MIKIIKKLVVNIKFLLSVFSRGKTKRLNHKRIFVIFVSTILNCLKANTR